jgi:hypothetical protein
VALADLADQQQDLLALGRFRNYRYRPSLLLPDCAHVVARLLINSLIIYEHSLRVGVELFGHFQLPIFITSIGCTGEKSMNA